MCAVLVEESLTRQLLQPSQQLQWMNKASLSPCTPTIFLISNSTGGRITD